MARAPGERQALGSPQAPREWKPGGVDGRGRWEQRLDDCDDDSERYEDCHEADKEAGADAVVRHAAPLMR